MSEIISVKNPRTGEADYQITAWSADKIADLSAQMRSHQKTWLSQGLEARCKALANLANTMEQEAQSIIDALQIDTGRKMLARAETLGVIGNMRAWAALAPTLMPQGNWIQGRAKPNFKHMNDYVLTIINTEHTLPYIL